MSRVMPNPPGLRHTLLTLLLISSLWPDPRLANAGELNEITDGPKVQLSLPDLDGRVRDLGEFSDKVVLVNFWASWCLPCLEEMPSIRRLAEEMADKPFAVIGINVGEAKGRVQATVKRFDIDFPVLLDKDSKVFKAWGATVLPTTYVIDRRGRVRYVGRGPLEWDGADMIELMMQLAEQPPAE